MMKFKPMAALAAAALVFTASASAAEQPAANEYRTMIQAGKFFLDYTENSTKHCIAQSDGKRIVEEYSSKGNAPKKAYRIEAMYQDGKYYTFSTAGDNRIAYVLPETEMENPALNPSEKWDDVPDQLALPEAIAVFGWHDRWVHHAPSVTEPAYSASSERKVGDKSYTCDRYVSDIRTQAGTVAGQIAYDMLYENGRLAIVQKSLLRGGQEKLLKTFHIQAFSSEVPEGAFEVQPAVRVFAAGMGDMNDLLGTPKQLETLGGEKKDAK